MGARLRTKTSTRHIVRAHADERVRASRFARSNFALLVRSYRTLPSLNLIYQRAKQLPFLLLRILLFFPFFFFFRSNGIYPIPDMRARIVLYECMHERAHVGYAVGITCAARFIVAWSNDRENI